MLTLAVFVFALVAMFALKAVSIVREHDALTANAAAFSWSSARPEDLETAESWTVEQPQAADAGVSLRTRHVASGANA